MEISHFLEAVRNDLRGVTHADDVASAAADRVLQALELSLPLRLMDAMGQAAVELSSQLPAGQVQVRLAGRDLQLVLTELPGDGAGPAAAKEEGETARLTLRLPEGLKTRMESAAGHEGISANTWLVRLIAREVERTGRPSRGGGRITGFAQA